MVGGADEDVERVRPLLDVVGATVVHQGPPGAGQHTKAVNQIAIASNMIGVSEALLYAQAAGLDPETVLESISSGAAGSWSLANLAPRMIAGDFAPGFYVEHFVKDLGIALHEAEGAELDLPGLTLAAELYRRFLADGGGRFGDSGADHDAGRAQPAGCPGALTGPGAGDRNRIMSGNAPAIARVARKAVMAAQSQPRPSPLSMTDQRRWRTAAPRPTWRRPTTRGRRRRSGSPSRAKTSPLSGCWSRHEDQDEGGELQDGLVGGEDAGQQLDSGQQERADERRRRRCRSGSSSRLRPAPSRPRPPRDGVRSGPGRRWRRHPASRAASAQIS